MKTNHIKDVSHIAPKYLYLVKSRVPLLMSRDLLPISILTTLAIEILAPLVTREPTTNL